MSLLSLSGSNMAGGTGASELEQQLASVAQGDHLCLIYENAAEQFAAAAAFIKQGLVRGERCLYVVDDRVVDEVVQALAAADVDVEKKRQRDALRLLTKCDSYLSAGEFSPQAMLDFLRRAEAEALAAGFSGLRFVGEMTWALGPEPGCDRLIEYEALLNHHVINSRTILLCQYNRSRFDAPCIHDVFRTHPFAILGDQVCSNPHYESPEMVLGQDQMMGSSELKNKRLDWWIKRLKKARAVEQERDRLARALRSREESVRVQLAELEQIYRHAPVGLCFVDRNLRFVRINEQLAAMNGKPVAEHIGRTIREMIPEVADQVEQSYHRVITSGEAALNVELHGVTAAEPGVERDWLESFCPLKSADGSVVGVTVAVMEVTERKQAERKLADYADRLQSLSRRLLDVQEAERRHLARELHDEVGQLLTGLRLLLKPNGDQANNGVRIRFEQAREVVDELLQRVRGLSFDLRPAVLDQLGLLPALLALFERYTEQTGVLVNFKHQGVEGRFAQEIETTAYRIVQEALTNVARHASVAGVTVRVWATADRLSVQIEDRGRGFDPEAALATSDSSGLAGMEERVRLLHGELQVESRPGGGTQITADMPLRT